MMVASVEGSETGEALSLLPRPSLGTERCVLRAVRFLSPHSVTLVAG